MKNLRRIAAVFFPSLFARRNEKMPGVALILVLIMFLFLYTSSVIFVRNAAGEAYSGVEKIFEETDDFYMSSARFNYNGHYEGRIDALKIVLIIDGSSDLAPEATDNSFITLFVGPNEGSVITSFGSYVINYAALEKSLGESIDFDKNMARAELGYGKSVFMNLVVSASVLIGILLFIIFLFCLVIISIPVYLIFRLLGAKIDFSRTLAVVMGSLVYPLLIAGLFFWVPDGLRFAFTNAVRCAICLCAVAVVYIVLAMIPLLVRAYKDKAQNKKKAVPEEAISEDNQSVAIEEISEETDHEVSSEEVIQQGEADAEEISSAESTASAEENDLSET